MNGVAAGFRSTRAAVLLAMSIALSVPLSAGAAALSLTSQHVTTTATCALVSYPKTSTFSIDSFVDEGNTSANNGTGNNISVQSQTSKNRRGYVQFDVANCLFAPPSTAIVRSAILRLDEAGPLPSTCRTYDVFRNTAAWGETTITWANQPQSTSSNQPPTSSRTASQDLGSPTTCANHTATTYVAWDVTADVSAFIAGTATNDGWMIRDDTEDNATAVKVNFSARDQNNLALAPQLMVTYTLV